MDLTRLARAQESRHRELLDLYRTRHAALDPADAATRSRSRVLALGILQEQAQVAFWAALAADPDALDVIPDEDR